jgi:tetratricopeptide (TPR) repeat protein
MTDSNKKGPDLDWDSAIDEWEKAFVPEVAQDKETKRAASLSSVPPAPAEGSRAHAASPAAAALQPPPAIEIPGTQPAPTGSRVPRAGSFVPRPAAKAPAAKPKEQAAPARDLSIPTPMPARDVSVPTPMPAADTPRPAVDDVDALLGASDDSVTAISDRPAGFGEGAKRASQPPPSMDLQVSDVELVDPNGEDATLFRPAGQRPAPAPELQGPSQPVFPRAPLTEPGFATVATADENEPTPLRAPAGTVGEEAVTAERPIAALGLDDEATRDFVAPVATKADKGARTWIADEVRDAFVGRAEWLEAEARAREDQEGQARGLLAVSEIRSLLGETGAAHALAVEAARLAPGLALAHKQARGLATSDDPESLVAALDHEASTLTVPAARAHAALFAADVLRLRGDEDMAVERWANAAKVGDGDVRIAVARVAYALSKGKLEQAGSLQPSRDAASIAKGLADALRVRGWKGLSAPADIDGPLAVNDALRRIREALDAGDIGAAVDALTEITKLPELAPGARWLAAALGQTRGSTRAKAGQTLVKLCADDERARRPLAGCAVELGDAAMLQVAMQEGGFSVADRAVLATLLDLPASELEPHLATLADADALAPLASAIAGTRRASLPAEGDPDRAEQVEVRSGRVAGRPSSRGSLRLARLVATSAPAKTIEAVAGSVPDSVEASAIALEMAVRGERFRDVSDAIKAWTPGPSSSGGASDHLLAAALVAERVHDVGRALSAYREARINDASNETLLRIIASLDPSIDPPGELNQLANELGAGMAGALVRLEAVVRETEVDDRTRSDLLERAHRAAPELAIPSFMAEHLARRSGDVEEVLRWIRERRAATTDTLEQALDNVREALLIADNNPQLASERLEEAHRTRPMDVALRELYERLAPEPPADRGPWREQRALVSTGDARALYFMEAAHEYERVGDRPQALRAAVAAVEAGDSVLARLTRERAEVEGGQPARLADELLGLARSTENSRERREAYERLADLDATARSDASSAVLWHRSILEEVADYKPSLRHIEHALISEGRDDELEPIASGIARALDGAGGGEGIAHASFASRLRARGPTGDVDSTLDLARLAASQPETSLGALRLQYAHARARHDDKTLLSTALSLVDRATRPLEISSLLVRAAETALRLNEVVQARELLERAKNEDPGDVVTWRLLADVRRRTGDASAAAEAFESLARASMVQAHQIAAWHDAAHLWLDDVHDEDRAVTAFEQASTIDVTYKDVFARLLALYTTRGAGGELAALLERRVGTITDPEERVAMEVERGLALLGVHDLSGARKALDSALSANPDHVAALRAFADLCAQQSDWEQAEQAWVRLARLLATPEEQRDVYARLGELYSVHAVNLSRAETSLKEVLKRAPGDVATLDRLIDIHKRQNDAPRAAEIVQQLATETKDPAERRKRLIELASIHEAPGRDLRKAEQVLEAARREAPTDVHVLRALAEFYIRHKQMPAVQILLDRAAADARRAFAAGRFAPALFEVMRAVFELRGKPDAALVVGATLAALDGHPTSLRGAEVRALDRRVDDLLAPETISPSLRSLLAQCGDALDIATPFDLRAAQATPLQTGPLHGIIAQIASAAGLPSIQVYTSPKLPRTCVALASGPPTLVVGETLAQTTNDRARAFLIVRALKLIMVHASALVRAPATEVVVLVSAWLQAFNPTWVPEGVNAGALASAAKRVASGLTQDVPPDAGVMALEIAGTLGAQMATLGASTLAWANRAALLAVGDPNAALDAVAWTLGKDGAPTEAKERASWVVRTREASDLLAYSVSDAYAEARSRVGLDR